MDKTSFNQLMTHLRPKLYRFALAFVGRTDEAEDVVQEIGIKLWERRGELDALRSVEAYAMSAVRNRCLDYARSPHSRTAEWVEAHDAVHEQTPYKSVEQSDMVAFVRRLIDRLPEQQQMVIRLRDIEGYELEEIAEILGMNGGTVRTSLSRARRKIREELLKQ
ncbi:MAG: sigma-70 family RNA polymerase sigma factor [Bacteroidales bacterium]|jgi:RNA polymerase sigma-70 factor (ECF subfamily)|nr:sigma-70 family RNA polymerase sigma factor [Bacteroidales bacterium]